LREVHRKDGWIHEQVKVGREKWIFLDAKLHESKKAEKYNSDEKLGAESSEGADLN
jgi:hypothetical protein